MSCSLFYAEKISQVTTSYCCAVNCVKLLIKENAKRNKFLPRHHNTQISYAILSGVGFNSCDWMIEMNMSRKSKIYAKCEEWKIV